MEYKLRKAVSGDIKLLFDWVNDEEVRSSSIDTQTISFEKHEEWFNNRLNSPHCVIFILEIDHSPAGVVRFEFNENAWEINYSIAKIYRGMGFGKLILSEGIRLHNQFPVIGYVKEENKKSQAVFNSLGFICDGVHLKKDCRLLKYIKNSADG